MLVPDWLIIWLAIIGVSALILRARLSASFFLMPAFIRFFLIPTLSIPEGVARVVLATLVPVVILFGGVRLLQRAVNTFYGDHAAGFVAGTYLVRIFDGFGGLIVLFAIAVAGVLIWMLV